MILYAVFNVCLILYAVFNLNTHMQNLISFFFFLKEKCCFQNAGLCLFCMSRFGQWGSHRGGFCKKLPEAVSCPVEPMPAGSKKDPPLAQAEPPSESGNTSGITYFRRGKSYCTRADAARERIENI